MRARDHITCIGPADGPPAPQGNHQSRYSPRAIPVTLQARGALPGGLRGSQLPSRPGSAHGCRSWSLTRPGGPVAPGPCGCRTRPPPGDWRRSAGYAARGISAIMPTAGLCRVELAREEKTGGSRALWVRSLGIIRGTPRRRAAGHPADSGPASHSPAWCGRALAPSSACRRGDTSAWFPPTRVRARARSPSDRRHAGGGPWPWCGAGHVG